MTDLTALKATLSALDSLVGVSGDEDEVAAGLRCEMEGLFDEHFSDALGNQYFVKKGRNPDKRVLFTAHMDEIGFIVTYIEPAGFARLAAVGYHDDAMAINQHLVFRTACGRKVQGVTAGGKPAHAVIQDKEHHALTLGDIFVDFGTESAAETRALGLEIGDYGTFARPGGFLNGGLYYTGKSVDDRAGLAVLVEALRRLKGVALEPTVCVAGTVQEEVGMRGAGPAVARFKPELMLAVDGTLTGGTPGYEERDCAQTMGGGMSVKFYDWDAIYGLTGNNVPRKLTNRMIEVARKYGLPFQREVITGGGTDAWSAATTGEGVLAGGISIPMRYMHSAVGLVNLRDLDCCASYIVYFLQDYVTIA